MSHIVIKVYSIECDANGCREVAEDYTVSAGDVRPLDSARRYIAQFGWSHRDGADYCPRHKQATP